MGKEVDDYIAGFPQETAATLRHLRKIIQAAAPEATEAISYRIPTFIHHGPLVGFAGFKNHCSLYVLSRTFLNAFKDELKAYETSKGTVRFPIGKPLPGPFLKKLARMKENEARK